MTTQSRQEVRAVDTTVKTTAYNCHNTLEERLAEQAEISFKAGIGEMVEWIMEHSTTGDKYPPYLCTVRWVLEEEWQAKLREWGIVTSRAKG